MTILTDRAPSRARTTPPAPRIERDRDGNDFVATPLGTITHVERDSFGAAIEGWPLLHFEAAGEPFDESALAEHIRACAAMLAHVDPGGINRLPRVPYGEIEPPASPDDDEQAAAHSPAAVAAQLSDHEAGVLAALLDHAAHLERHDEDGEHWVWDTPGGKAGFSDDDYEAIAALGAAGLLAGHRPTPLGRQVAELIARGAELAGVA